MLPQIAQGDANKVWVIPSELTQALGGMSERLLPQARDKSGYNVRCVQLPMNGSCLSF